MTLQNWMKFGLCPAVGVQKFSKHGLFWHVLGLFWAAATDYAYAWQQTCQDAISESQWNWWTCRHPQWKSIMWQSWWWWWDETPPNSKALWQQTKESATKCSAQILWKESNFTNLKLKPQINLIHPIEIAFSYDNFTFKWANTSCHPPSPSLAMDFGNLPRWKMGEMPWNTIDFVKSLGFFNPPLCTPNCLCPTLCIWMMLCYFCTSFSSWFTFDEIVCAKLFTRNVKLSVTKTPKRKGPWMHDIWQQLLGILPHPDQRVVPSSKTSWIYMNISSTPNSAFKTKEAWTWQCRLKMFDDVSWFFYMAVEM